MYTCDTWVADAVSDAAVSETALATALRRSNLVTLSLSMCGIDGAAAARLGRALHGNTTAQTLDLGWNPIGDEGASALAATLPSTRVSRLDLRACSLSDATAQKLCAAIAGDVPHTAAATGQVVEVLLSGNGAISAAQLEAVEAATERNRRNALCLRCGELGHIMAEESRCPLATNNDAVAVAATALEVPSLAATGLAAMAKTASVPTRCAQPSQPPPPAAVTAAATQQVRPSSACPCRHTRAPSCATNLSKHKATDKSLT